MAAPKRKSPEKKPVRRKGPTPATRLLQSTVAGIVRYPRLIGGVASFGVVFSFVAANALWYQPRQHPAPLLATRMFEDATRSMPVTETPEAVAAEPHVTTYRIERQSDQPEAAPVAQKPSPLVRKVQQALATRGLYNGPADGLTGPRTTAAILFFEETEGLEPTGEASDALIARLSAQPAEASGDVAVVPVERPSPDVTASTKVDDDVAALILADQDRSGTLPLPVQKPASAKKPASSDNQDAAAKTVPVETVMKIQKALSRFAYADVKVDGVAGAATRAAIRSFEKNYNLPVTGEPSDRVLKKLKAIGAI